MQPIRWSLALALMVPTALWLLADSLVANGTGWFAVRAPLLQWSGILAIVAMAAAVLLAVRPPWLERRLSGLDKAYRLRKWLGIAALTASVVHWWMAKGSKWLVGWGWLERPVRGPRRSAEGAVQTWLADQRHLAESIGEWAFYATVVLIVLALARRVPYHVFRPVHRWLSLVWLLLAWHALNLTKTAYWSAPIGWLLALAWPPAPSPPSSRARAASGAAGACRVASSR